MGLKLIKNKSYDKNYDTIVKSLYEIESNRDVFSIKSRALQGNNDNDDLDFKNSGFVKKDNCEYYNKLMELIYLHNLDEDKFQSELSKINEKTEQRKKAGVYFTPIDVSDFIIYNSIFKYISDKTGISYNPTGVNKFLNIIQGLSKSDKKGIYKILLDIKVFDPTCGSGVFLIQFFDAITNIFRNLNLRILEKDIVKILGNIFGNDFDKLSAYITKTRLLFKVFRNYPKIEPRIILNILNKNLLSYDFITEEKFDRKFDLIIGNPPYVESSKLNYSTKYKNIYADVIHKSLELLNDKGVLGFIIPLSYISTPRMNYIRKAVEKECEAQYLLSYSDRPDCLFNGVHQKLNILVCQKKFSQTCNTYTSDYIYWYKKEREKLFYKKTVIENKYSYNWGYPKISNKIENSIFKKVIDNKITIKDLTNVNEKNTLFLNSRATFWIKSFIKKPYDFSREYKELLLSEGNLHLCNCILNSSLFWWFWIKISDCWHLTERELNSFTIPKIPKSQLVDLMKKSKLLSESLEQTKKEVNTKQVKYIYQHKKCKNIIDEIDNILGKIYNLTHLETEYIKKYKEKYRLNNVNTKRPLQIIDLFAGCGGFSTGFIQSGYKVLCAVEFDKNIAETYSLNHKDTKVIIDDIRHVEKQLFDYKVDVIIGGPPCQGFSMAGARIRNGFIDDKRNYLFKSYFKIVRNLKPKIFVIENVKGLTNYKGGAIFNKIKDVFENPNNFNGDIYHLHYKIFKAKNFGIPQNRERLIIIGVLNKKIDFNKIIVATKNKIAIKKKGFFKNVNVWDAISNLTANSSNGEIKDLKYFNEYQESLSSPKKNTYNHIKPRHQKNAVERIKQIKQGENFTHLKEKINSIHSGSYGRLKVDELSPTITTRFDTPSAGRFIHPYEDRTLSPREGARIQSFPDDFIFYGNKTSVYKQIGNAVPPKLAYFIAEMLKEILSYE